MNLKEIERKFLVKGDFKSEAYSSYRIKQGYLSSTPERTVRIRIRNQEGYITIKGKGNEEGISRFEWEKRINKEEAEQLLQICEPGIIDKIRYLIKEGEHIFEVDEFYGENDGLVIAEVELKNEGEDFIRPEWLGEEVTGDIKYYNSYLSKKPFLSWKKL